jgi:hypothetical protein
VRAAHHRRERIVPPGPAAEDVAHLVDRDLAVDLLQPFHELVAGFLILVGEGQALDPSAGGRPDPGHLFQGGLQSLSVHAQFVVVHNCLHEIGFGVQGSAKISGRVPGRPTPRSALETTGSALLHFLNPDR